MRFSSRPVITVLIALVAVVAIAGGYFATGSLRVQPHQAHAAGGYHKLGHLLSSADNTAAHIDCTTPQSFGCTEVQDSDQVFGEGSPYIGHDEPSLLFYSKTPGSGNRMQWHLTLPTDPSPSLAGTAGVGFNFQLHPAFWFGMAMCDTQSYPEQLSGCPADSDANIVDPAVSAAHPGVAFMEMQFYPPGWVEWPAGNSCDPTKWCAALNIDSLSENAVTGQILNPTCQSMVGLEYVNFAFITKSGVPHAPPSPVNSTPATFTPNPATDLFMNSGDKLVVTMHDTASGLRIDIQDQTTHQHGFMTSSAANGFGQVQFAPTGTSCNNIPYDFHPMYSTSSEQTRVTWAAHSYNIAFADEIGHFDYCNGGNAISFGGSCPAANTEGSAADTEPADVDDVACFPSSASSLVSVAGCIGTNTGFDGVAYQHSWPDGNTTLHPTAIRFSSPKTGNGYNIAYSRVAFEADLPRIEFSTCDRNTGTGCTLIPQTDDGKPAVFYPFFSDAKVGGKCTWQIGDHIPGSLNDFGQNGEYGTLLNSAYTAVGGGVLTRYNNFRQILSTNPC